MMESILQNPLEKWEHLRLGSVDLIFSQSVGMMAQEEVPQTRGQTFVATLLPAKEASRPKLLLLHYLYTIYEQNIFL